MDVKVSGVDLKSEVQPPKNGIISAVSLELAEPGRARAELKLAGPAQVQQAYVLEPFDDQPARLVVDIIPDTPERFAQRVREDFVGSQMRGSKDIVNPSTPPGGSNVASHTRPLIVIDPGHGGIDGGAEAPSGIKEKDIVLDFALELQKLLVATDRFDVALTREDDTFLRLEERVSLARANKADLFISIHADSFQEPTARGASVYTRDERATDVLDKVLAEQENKADLVAGFAVPDGEPEVVNILVDLMRRETRRQSYLAANAHGATSSSPASDCGVSPCGRRISSCCRRPRCPRFWSSSGFLSNDKDIANLTAGAWRDRTAEALARGISAYFDDQM